MTQRLTTESLCRLRDHLKRDQAFLEHANQTKIRLCMGGGCMASGANELLTVLVHELDQANVDGIQCNLMTTGCLGPCSGGPVLCIDETFYEHVQPEDISELIQEHVQNGKILQRLTRGRVRQGP